MQLTPQLLLSAYSQGIFPMGNDRGELWWYDPNPRAILPLEGFHVPRSLAQRIRRGGFEVRVDTAFRGVITACGTPTPKREGVWITPEIREAYCLLHEFGFAHSVETWVEGQLVGGLFAGESMFSRATDASKIALVFLVEHLRAQGFTLHDTQFLTPHLQRFGAIEISRAAYRRRLQAAMQVWTEF